MSQDLERVEELIAATNSAKARVTFLAKMAWFWAGLVLVMVAIDVLAAVRLTRATRLDRQACETYAAASQALADANEVKMAADAQRRAMLDQRTNDLQPLGPPAEAFIPFETTERSPD